MGGAEFKGEGKKPKRVAPALRSFLKIDNGKRVIPTFLNPAIVFDKKTLQTLVQKDTNKTNTEFKKITAKPTDATISELPSATENAGGNGGNELPPIKNGEYGESSDKPQTFAEAISFMQPFDGMQKEIGSGEKTEVTKRFKDYILKLFEDNLNAWYFKTLPNPTDPDTIWKKLQLEDGTSISFYIEKNDFRPDRSRVIGVTHYSPILKEDLEIHTYWLDENGEVRRFDNINLVEKERVRKKLGEDIKHLPPEKALEAIKKERARLIEGKNNDELEQVMGLNRCPIGLDELQGLKKLVDMAKIVTISQ